ncbi:GAG-pre-integrase domain [Popillia japonica]|uniref:GAG-pre-integrase domain n=1 Tax=Popillia japonica TaxID=7064 RepID=A0AAW1L867_POPJA
MKWKTEEAQQAITITDNTSLWHRRLGHVNYKTLYEMKQKGVVEGIEGTLEKNGQVCESCIAGKQTRLPHKQQRPKTKRVLELIHSDDIGELKYFLGLKITQKIKNKLKREFDMQDIGELKYFLGLKITQKRECGILEISQRKYIIDVLQKFGMPDCKPSSTTIEPALNTTIENEDKGLETIHGQLIGCLLYTTIC